uniref:Uncharacterized protein n=1 Tax=Anopheles funestus TaxID=62324 RepID=A0A182RKR7_ANOFN
MANSTDTENTQSALENVESFLLQFASHSPKLLDEMRSAGTILKQTNIRSFNSLSSDTCDLPSTIAIELRQAAEAADSKQFFICSQKIKNSSRILQMLMEEAKRTRRKIDSLSALNITTLERQSLQRHCIHLEQALSVLYALNLDLHEVQLTANALYIHGLKEETLELQEMNGLKEAIARLISIVSTKHFKSIYTPIIQQ